MYYDEYTGLQLKAGRFLSQIESLEKRLGPDNA